MVGNAKAIHRLTDVISRTSLAALLAGAILICRIRPSLHVLLPADDVRI